MNAFEFVGLILIGLGIGVFVLAGVAYGISQFLEEP
jgi:hypothetical protein